MTNTTRKISILAAATLLLMMCLLIPKGVEGVYQANYILDSVCIVICMVLYINLYRSGKADLFSPCSFFSLLYIVMFYVTPIYDIITGECLWFGVDLFDQGIKSSLYALVGYFAFYIVTKYRFTIGKKHVRFSANCSFESKEDAFCLTNYAIVFIAFGYCTCLLANIFYLVASGGTSVLYILTMGLAGSTGNNTAADIGAISMLSYALPSFTLLYFEYGKNRFLKVLAFLVMFELQVARGFRFFILQIVVMFGAYYYLRNEKKPRLVHLLLIAFLTLIPLVLMTLFRSNMRAGMGIDLSIINGNAVSEALDAAFWDNLRIYKNYYALVKVVPKETSYLFGAQTIIYTVIMLIPRAIWSSKPGNPGTVAQRIALGNAAVKGGSAYPALGEYYYDFGVVGILFWMIVFGLFLRKIENKYRYGSSSHIDLMVYCTILGTVLQFTIRGYMPSNFWMLVFCMIPYWLMKKFFMRRKYLE